MGGKARASSLGAASAAESSRARAGKNALDNVRQWEPHIIMPTAVYTAEQVRRLLGLAKSTLSTEIARGRLRVSRGAGRYWCLGSWLLEWIASGEKPSRRGANRVSPADSPAKEGG